ELDLSFESIKPRNGSVFHGRSRLATRYSREQIHNTKAIKKHSPSHFQILSNIHLITRYEERVARIQSILRDRQNSLDSNSHYNESTTTTTINNDLLPTSSSMPFPFTDNDVRDNLLEVDCDNGTTMSSTATSIPSTIATIDTSSSRQAILDLRESEGNSVHPVNNIPGNSAHSVNNNISGNSIQINGITNSNSSYPFTRTNGTLDSLQRSTSFT
ncbi:12204_t:CDS:1, partial [Ambispora gerdemannii]